MKAAIYCRLSQEDAFHVTAQGESESIQNQRAMLQKYAAAHQYEVYRVYCDENYSGMDGERPAFNQLLADAKAHRFSIVLVKTLSRFTRDLAVVEKYIHGCFPEWGIRFIAVVDHSDTNDRASKKPRQLHGLINEWYLEDLSCNVRSVLAHRCREGLYIGAIAPYGYRRNPDSKGRLCIDPEAAAIVRHVFALYLSGLGTAQVADLLNQGGISPPNYYKFQSGILHQNLSGGKWNAGTVARTLQNPCYKGTLVQGKSERCSFKSRKKTAKSESEWIIVQNTHAPIVPPETFDLVQLLLGSHGRASSTGTIPPLSGKLFCAVCGGRLTAYGSHSYICRTCRQQSRKAVPCADRAALEALILRHIQKRCSTPGTYVPDILQSGIKSSALSRALVCFFIDKVFVAGSGLAMQIAVEWRERASE